MKRCSKCKIEKPLDNFCRDRSRSDGLQSRCKDCSRKISKAYNAANPDRVRKTTRAWIAANSGRIKAYIREWNAANPERIRTNTKLWRAANPERYRANSREYQRIRRQTDVNYRLSCNVRSRLRKAIRNGSKNGSALSDLGCQIDELKIHLEKQFTPGMSWNNYGYRGWHIDHIVALSNFDLSDKEQFLKAVHYTNLQPLWWKDNIKKSNHGRE